MLCKQSWHKKLFSSQELCEGKECECQPLQFENWTPGDSYIFKCFWTETELMTNGNYVKLAEG